MKFISLIWILILTLSFSITGVGQTIYDGSSYMYAYGNNGLVTVKWECSPKPGITSALLGCKLFRQNYYFEPEIELTPQILFEPDGTYEFKDTLEILDTVPYIYHLWAYYSDTILEVTGCQAVKYFEIIPYNTEVLAVKIKIKDAVPFFEMDYCDAIGMNCLGATSDSIEFYLPYSIFDYCSDVKLEQEIFLDSSMYMWGRITLSDEYLYALLLTLKTDNLRFIHNSTIYPNPGNDYIIIENAEPGSLLQLIDPKGQIVLNKRIQTGREVTITSELPPGFYIYQIQNKNGYIQKGKWVKQ